MSFFCFDLFSFPTIQLKKLQQFSNYAYGLDLWFGDCVTFAFFHINKHGYKWNKIYSYSIIQIWTSHISRLLIAVEDPKHGMIWPVFQHVFWQRRILLCLSNIFIANPIVWPFSLVLLYCHFGVENALAKAPQS